MKFTAFENDMQMLLAERMGKLLDDWISVCVDGELSRRAIALLLLKVLHARMLQVLLVLDPSLTGPKYAEIAKRAFDGLTPRIREITARYENDIKRATERG